MSLPFGSFGESSSRDVATKWAALVLVLLSLAIATPAQKTEEHEKDDPRARAEYLEQKRGGRAGTPPGARLRALKEVDGMLEREGKAYWDSVSKASTSPSVESSTAVRETTAIVPSSSQWTPLGPQPTNSTGGGAHYSGRVTALAVDPNNPSTIYLGAAQGGVWKSADSGASWTALTDQQLSLAIGSIAIDPTNSQVIYVGTGEENFGSDNYYGAGVLKSTDGGATWTRLGQPQFAPSTPFCTSDFLGCGGARIGAIAIQPGDSSHLLAAADTAFSNSPGLFWSPDGGTTWTAVTGASSAPADSVVFLNSATALVGMHKQGVFSCTGFTGTPSCVVANGTGGNIIAVAGTDRVSLGAAGNTVYAALAIASSSALSGLYKSTDAGVYWTKLNNTPDFCVDQCFYDMLVAVNPTNAQDLFVGGSGYPNDNFLYRSIDGGISWTLSTSNIHADQHAAAYTPDGTKMYIGNDGGVYSTTNTTSGNVVWTELNSTLNITQFYGYFALHPSDPQITFAGSQDNGTQRFTGMLAWDEVTCGDGAGAVIDVNNPSIVFANCQGVDIRRSATGDAKDFEPKNTSGATIANSGDRVSFIPPMVGDTTSPNMNLYFGTFRLWQGTTAAAPPTWTAITGDLTASTSEIITNIGISPDSTTAYVVTSNGRVSKVANLASTHDVTNVTPSAASGFPQPNSTNNFSATQINAVNVITPTLAYIGVAGFTAGAHVFKTADGINWTNVSGDLPNTPVNDVVVDPDIPNSLYAATDVGVFQSMNDGANWAPLSNSLPRVAVYGLKLHRPSRTLRAATHGRGMWDLYVPFCTIGPCASVAPRGVSFGRQKVGTTSAAATVTLTNAGTSTLTVNSISIPAGDFAQTSNCSSVAPNGGTCTISISFSPSAAEFRTNTLTVVTNATPATVTAALSGTGAVVPPTDVFGSAKAISVVPYTDTVNTLSAVSAPTDPMPACVDSEFDTNPRFNHHAVRYLYTPKVNGNISIDTNGSAYDTVLSVWTWDTAVGFTVVPNGCNDDITNGVVRTSRIIALPVTAGVNYYILVSGYYPEDAGTMTINVSGTPAALLSKGSLSMSSIIGRSSAETLTYFNNTGAPITVSSVGVSGAAFTRTETCSGAGSIANGGSCSITVTFSPGAVGPFAGSITVNDSGAGSPRSVTLNGTGVNFTLSAARNSRNGAAGTGTSTSPGSRPARPVRSAADIVVVAGQSRSLDLELTSSGNSNEVINLECAGAPPGATCTVEPGQVALNGDSIPIQVKFGTAGAGVSAVSGRAKRLTVNSRVVSGTYELQINARVGDVVRTLSVEAQVTVNQPNRHRLPVQ